ncbi:hypothetical protein [Flavobacterium sp. 7A]|uniref:hypothetical protein n=1 Tax=Flavobacterium sp. 7A TaxID=2940571 RepID=UPI002227A29E|nr:hypothetical protein [Flavobacterium sp. 7A]MCW2120915.1 hypothetical protein [Flavobacterium sp. 7A]
MIKKLFIQYLLLSFLVLFGGTGTSMYAIHLDHSTSALCSLKSHDNHSTLLTNYFDHSDIFLNTQHSSGGRDLNKLRATDNEGEEDEVLTSKKELINTANYLATFYQITDDIAYYGSCNKRTVYRITFDCYTSCRKYVLFQVFRI